MDTNSTLNSIFMQTFGISDYVVFAVMLLVCAGIGVYFGFFSGEMTEEKYLVGEGHMKTFPVAMSLIASMLSGITLIGTPTEVYLYGTQICYVLLAVLLMGAVLGYAYLPVFYELHFTSTNEYLARRYNNSIRLFGSFIFIVGAIIYLPMVVYVPALTFNQVTGVSVHAVTPVVSLVCIFYTCVGGLKAVVWTDFIQAFFMFGSVLIVAIKGTINIGGITTLIERSYDSGRIEPPVFDIDPTVRLTIWSVFIGGFVNWLQWNGTNQNMLQRYQALPTLYHARQAMWIYIIGTICVLFVCMYSGLLAFASYYDCDPLTTQVVKNKDQIFPVYVMETLGMYPGLAGFFLAGVFSAALSSLSTVLNSMSAVILEDFYKRCRKSELSQRESNIVMKSVVLIVGALCLILVFVVEKLGTILQLSVSLGCIANGAALGIFSMGVFLPWVNAMGALVGGITSLIVTGWISLGAQAAEALGAIVYEKKPFSVEGCTYDFQLPEVHPTEASASDVFVLFRVSFLWYTLIGFFICVIVGVIVSSITGFNDINDIDPQFLSPLIRRYLPNYSKVQKYSAEEIKLINSHISNVEIKVEKNNST